jgi:hypothetical protein
VLRKILIAIVLAAALVYFFNTKDEGGTGLTLWDPRDGPAVEAADTIVAPSEPVAAPETKPSDAARNLHVRGSVLRIDGTPVAGVHIEHRHPYLKLVATQSAADGSFGLDIEEARGELAIVEDAWLLLGGERFVSPSRTDGYLLVVAPSTAVAGRVVDDEGAAVQGAIVRALAPSDALTALDIAATPIEDPRSNVFSDAQGNFRVPVVPQLPKVRIEVSLTGYTTLEQTIDLPANDGIALVLHWSK